MPANTLPDPFTSPQARDLRRRIQAIRITRLHWSEYVFHFVMDGLGFGRSLRDLPDYRLAELYKIVAAYRPPRDEAFAYDSENRYLYHLQKEAGWSDLTLRQYLTLTFKKTHLNLLDSAERAAVRALLDNIITANKGDNHD